MAPYGLNKIGIEYQPCNAIGHYAFTVPLLPILRTTASLPGSQVRIINVSSDMHEAASPQTVDFSSIEGLNAKTQPASIRYGNGKAEVSMSDC
jgi:NAD(P)-dependent dehydrogenase (short-subunit alcohol dehydrogenase family)